MATLKDISILFLLILGFLGFLFSFGEDIHLMAGNNILLTPNPIIRAGVIALTEDITINDLTATGNITGNQIYAEMWNYSLVGSPYQFDIDLADTYYNLTGLVPGNLNGFTFTDDTEINGGSYLTAQIAGQYKVSASMSFLSEANGGLYGVSISRNFNQSKHRDCYSRRAAATTVGNVGVTCFIDIDVGDKINIRVENENNNRDLFIHTLNLNILRVGDMRD